MRTPPPRCIELGVYAQTMLAKFSDNSAVAPLGDMLGAATQALAQAEAAYAEARLQVTAARVEVEFADHMADRHVRALLRIIEIADGTTRGRLASALLPEGITPIIRPLGEAQAMQMRALEGRLEAMGSQWERAADEKAKLTAERERYEAALAMRRAVFQTVDDMRARRDAVKQQFLDVYARVTAHVKAAFPRNRAMQDLFFDEVSERRSRDTGEGGGEVPLLAEDSAQAGGGRRNARCDSENSQRVPIEERNIVPEETVPAIVEPDRAERILGGLDAVRVDCPSEPESINYFEPHSGGVRQAVF